jgi:hypothetical protein
MGVEINKYPGMNALMVRYLAPFDASVDVVEANQGVNHYYDPNKTLYVLIDFTKAGMGFSDVVGLLAASASGEGNEEGGYYAGAEGVESVVFGEDELIKNIHEWAKQEQYNSIGSQLFKTEAEAVAYVRQQASK